MTTRKIDCSFLSSPRWQKLAFMVAFLATGSLYAEDQTINNLNDTDNSASVSVDGTLTLTNSADSSFGSDGKSVTATGLTVQAGDYTQTLTGALNIGGTAGSTAATISSGTLNLSGTAASLDSAGTVQINSGAKLLFTGIVPHNLTNALTINIGSGGTLEFTNMLDANHDYTNALTGTDGTNTTKAVTITGDGTFLKSGTGTLCMQYNGSAIAKIALSGSATIDVQSGKFLAGGWNSHDWSQNAATLNIGATGIVDQWDGKIMQIGGLTGDAGAKIISSTGSTDATRGGFRIGAGTTSGQEFTYNGAVSLTNASSKFIKTGEGTQNITGAFSNSGVTTIESGVLNVSGSYDSVTTTIESGVLNVSGSYNSGTTSITGGTLKLSGAVTVGAGGMSFSNTGVLDLSEATSLTVNGALNLQNVAYTISNLSGNSSGIITSNAATLTLNQPKDLTYEGVIAGTAKVVYANNVGTLTLSGQNTFSGGLVITDSMIRSKADSVVTDGTLVSGAFGTGTIYMDKATIQNNENSPVIANDIVLVSNSSFRSGWSGYTIELTGQVSGTGQLEVASDGYAVKLSHADNTYSGGTKIGGGLRSFNGTATTLILGANNALGTGAITFGTSGSTLDMNGWSATVANASGGNGIIKNDTEAQSVLTLNNITGAKTYSGTITGNVKLVIDYANGNTDSNYAVLSGANTYTGGTEIAEGAVRIGALEVFDEGGNLVSSAFGTGPVTLSGGTIQNSENSPTISQSIVLADGTASSIRSGWTNMTISLTGEISGGGSLEIANDSSSVKISHANNTYSGGTKIGGGKNGFTSGQGTLILGAENALGTGAISFGSNNSRLDLAGFSQTFVGIDNSNGSGGFYTGNAINNTVDGTATAIDLTVTVAEGGNYAYSGALPTLTSLTKSGAGAQKFGGALTVPTITVTGGVLELGAAPTTSTFDVQAGSILKLDASFTAATGTFTGAGTIIVSAIPGNTYNMDGSGFSGDFEILTGIVPVGSSASFGTGKLILSGGTIKNNDNSITIANNIELTDGTASSIRSGWSNRTVSLTGEISGGGSLEIANDSSSVKITHANNTYTGGTKIGGGKNGHTSGQGTLILGAENALGTGLVTFGAANSSLDLGGFDQTINGLESGDLSGLSIKNSAAGTSPNLTINVDEGKSYKFTGSVSAGTVIKAGAGSQAVGGITASSLAITAGKLTILGKSSLSSGTLTGSGDLLFNSTASGEESTYNLNGSAFTGNIEIASGILAISNQNLGSETITLSGGTVKNNDNSITIANNIELTDGTASSIRSGWTNRTVSLAGEISGGGSLEIASDSSSVKITHANNTYTGGTKIGGGKNSWGDAAGKGTLILGAENALGTGPVTFGAANSSLDLAGFSQTIGGLYDTDNFPNTGTIKNTGAAAALTLDVDAGKNYFWSGTFENSDKVSLVKTGEGIQTFARSQSFTSTMIEEGGIMLSGEGVNFSGPIVVEPGAYLTTDPTDGVYHELAPFTGDLKIIAESNTQVSRFALTVAPTFDPELGFIEIMVQEGAKLSSGAAFQVSNANPGATADADLESWLASSNRYEWNLLWDNANSKMTLQRDAAAVPEPTSWALLLLSVLGAAFGWRQTKQSRRQE